MSQAYFVLLGKITAELWTTHQSRCKASLPLLTIQSTSTHDGFHIHSCAPSDTSRRISAPSIRILFIVRINPLDLIAVQDGHVLSVQTTRMGETRSYAATRA
ncbi:uncharacterized protein L203_103808 [Cryptococcus depauperatus CBS 7841]|uniref:Uncharacterized protein n=1 Tax=Cryptococcus depauperatus CBS 7841 TaxID=1295531 RepID=A0AAJ8JUB0_9TREE